MLSVGLFLLSIVLTFTFCVVLLFVPYKPMYNFFEVRTALHPLTDVSVGKRRITPFVFAFSSCVSFRMSNSN